MKEGGKVSVVVADYPHPPSGAAMVQRLDSLGVPTYYRLVTDLSNIMSKVSFHILSFAELLHENADGCNKRKEHFLMS